MPKRLRIALVPLDDRPVCLQYPTMMAPLAHAEVVAPPIELLGRFTTPGDTDAIARWLRAQDWRAFDALIVSTDMLAYGGLVASRVHARRCRHGAPPARRARRDSQGPRDTADLRASA